jgi:hypothetical protein
MEDSNANQATSQSPITSRPSPTGRRSGGPRTAEGKRRSCHNAHKHGLYTDKRFLESAALELGDDPRQFQRLLKSLVEARRPVGGLEMALQWPLFRCENEFVLRPPFQLSPFFAINL